MSLLFLIWLLKGLNVNNSPLHWIVLMGKISLQLIFHYQALSLPSQRPPLEALLSARTIHLITIPSWAFSVLFPHGEASLTASRHETVSMQVDSQLDVAAAWGVEDGWCIPLSLLTDVIHLVKLAHIDKFTIILIVVMYLWTTALYLMPLQCLLGNESRGWSLLEDAQ